MILTEDFSLEEFQKDDTIPADCIPAFVQLATTILEPIRRHFNLAIRIHSGYRSPDHNLKVGGVKTSEHIASPTHCACDFDLNVSLEDVFDWIRLESGLPFHQVILERPSWEKAPTTIHISYNSEKPEREAIERLTGSNKGGINKKREVR